MKFMTCFEANKQQIDCFFVQQFAKNQTLIEFPARKRAFALTAQSLIKINGINFLHYN